MSTAEPSSGRSPRILAVDDQPANLALVRRILTPAGFEVGEARSGAEALASARERPPDLILLDMHLPDMHGLEVLRRLRDSSWGAGLKVVAMSALANPEDQRLWLRAGCLGAIEKPITVATFVETITGYLTAPDGSAEPLVFPPDGTGRDRLGEILVAHGLTSPEQLARAVATQRSSRKRLGQILVDQGAVTEDDIAWALSSQLGYPYIFLTPDIIDETAARALPDDFLRQRHVLPILRFGEEMTLAMADPTDQQTVDEVAGFLKGWLDAARIFEERPEYAAEVYGRSLKARGYELPAEVILQVVRRLNVRAGAVALSPPFVEFVKEEAQLMHKAGPLKQIPDWSRALRPALLGR